MICQCCVHNLFVLPPSDLKNYHNTVEYKHTPKYCTKVQLKQQIEIKPFNSLDYYYCYNFCHDNYNHQSVVVKS